MLLTMNFYAIDNEFRHNIVKVICDKVPVNVHVKSTRRECESQNLLRGKAQS